MNVKEQAASLVLRYMSKFPKVELAKQCAKICVDEILKANPTLITCNHSELNYAFWIEVQKEIEKI